MGNFSYICKGCNTPVNDMEKCVFFLLDKGIIVEYQIGTNNNYGATTEAERKEHSFSGETWKYKDWDELVTMMCGNDKTSGFAVYHQVCYHDQIPTEESEDDPNQGWGEMRDKYCKKNNIFKHMPEEVKKTICAIKL